MILTCSVGAGRASLDSSSSSDLDASVEDEEVGVEGRVGTGLETELVLDIASLAPEEVAGRIARWLWWVGEFMSWGDD